eukprot:848975-Rhodomonas_salina.2
MTGDIPVAASVEVAALWSLAFQTTLTSTNIAASATLADTATTIEAAGLNAAPCPDADCMALMLLFAQGRGLLIGVIGSTDRTPMPAPTTASQLMKKSALKRPQERRCIFQLSE